MRIAVRRLRTSLVALYILALGLVACSASVAPSQPSPILHTSISVGGQLRGYRLFRPPALGNRPAPLVVLLHGCFPGANGEGAASALNFDHEASSAGFVAVYPDGIDGCWNQGRSGSTVDDVGFIGSLLDRLVKQLPIDRSRIFVTGGSGGGAMAYRLACELSSRITAIASVAGAWWLDAPCRPARPVSVLEMHGSADSRTPYDGGGAFNVSPVLAVVQRWAELDGCLGDPALAQSGVTKSSAWNRCNGGTVVRLDTIVGGSHTWFGCRVPPCDPVPGEPDANAVVWNFFNGLRSSA
jgi:polyhydroxybutyrate depolymerase